MRRAKKTSTEPFNSRSAGPRIASIDPSEFRAKTVGVPKMQADTSCGVRSLRWISLMGIGKERQA